MGTIEGQWRFSMGRRRALASLATMLAGSPLLRAQLDPRGVLNGHKRMLGIDEMTSAFDFEPICFANMTLERFDYMQHGDGSEFNLRRDRQAFDWVDIVPGKAIDPKSVDLSSTLLGINLKFPVYVAPSSGQGALHPDGEMGMYRDPPPQAPLWQSRADHRFPIRALPPQRRAHAGTSFTQYRISTAPKTR